MQQQRVVNDLEAAGVRRLPVARGTCKLEVPSQNQQIQIKTQIQMEIQIQIRNNPVARREGLRYLYQSTSINKISIFFHPFHSTLPITH